MTNQLRSDDVCVGDLLSGLHLYEIPAFQRDYSWSEQRGQRLLDDVVAACDIARQSSEPLPFFLGTMLFVGSDEPDSSVRSALVVDGQQRLITLTILISVLRDQVAAQHKHQLHAHIAILTQAEPFEFDVFHVRPRAADARFLERAIQRRGATRLPRGKADLKPANEAQRRMESVRAFFSKRIKSYSVPRRLQIATFLLERCRALVLWAPDIDYAYRLFLSINKPGQPLSDEDIVLAEVVGPLGVTQRRRYETVIAQMSRYREPQKKGRRQDKTFFTHLALAQKWARSDRMISLLRRVVAREGGPTRFASTVFEPMAEAYLVTRGDWPREAHSQEVWHSLDCLRVLERFCDSEWVAPAMLALARLKDDEPRLTAFFRALDRFAHMLVLTREAADDRRAAYRQVIDHIWRSETFPELGLLFLLDEQRQAAAVRKAALKLKDAANGADKVILLRLDACLSRRPISDYLHLTESTFIDQNMLTLEHVLPNGETLAKSSGWRSEFGQIRYRRAMANCIGNLVLLEGGRNNAAGQADFSEKKDRYFAGGARHELLLTEQIRNLDQWTRQTLEDRYRYLMAAFLETWNFTAPIPNLPPEPLTESAPGQGPSNGQKPEHTLNTPSQTDHGP